jgi:hypothetical protein
MAWGLGPAFAVNYPAFTAAVNGLSPNFLEAMNQSSWTNITVNRKAIQEQLFANAAAAMKTSADPSALIWPGVTPMQAAGGGLGSLFVVGLGIWGGVKLYKNRGPIANFTKEKWNSLRGKTHEKADGKDGKEP